jgi:hypothetical protein
MGGSAKGGDSLSAPATGGASGNRQTTGGSDQVGTGGIAASGGTGGSSAGTSFSMGEGGVSDDCTLPETGETRANGLVRLYTKMDFLSFVGRVGIDGNYAYFTDGTNAYSALGRIDLTTGAVAEVGTVNGTPIVVHADTVYFAMTDSTTQKTALLSASLSDLTSPTLLVAAESIVGNLFADDQALYWSSYGSGGIWSVPLAGGTATNLASAGVPNGMVLQADDVYWLDFATSYLERVPKTGGNTEQLIAIKSDGVMAADDQAIYWADGSMGGINRWQLGASTATRVVDFDNSDNPNGLVVDGGTVYYSTGFLCGSVFKVSSDGRNKALLANGFHSGGLIGVDAAHLYITSSDGVFRVDR